MIKTNDLPRTRNEGWGFYGTMQDHAEAAWPLAMLAIHQVTGASLEDVAAFLDSRQGRHFADCVLSEMHRGAGLDDAIDPVVRQWMNWRVRSPEASRHGMPVGMPYLLAWVVHEGLQAELEDR